MENDPCEIFDRFKRSRNIAQLDAVGLANEFLACARWDHALRNMLFHGGQARPPEVQKKLNYHIDKNAPHLSGVRSELTRRGQAGIDEIEKLFLLGDPDLIYRLGNAHIDFIPETAKQVLTRLLSSEELEEKHRKVLTDMLGAVNRRLAGESVTPSDD